MPTYLDVGQQLLDNLCFSLGLRSKLAAFSSIQTFALQEWACSEVPNAPPYPSLIGDDHSPFEYSVAFAGNRAQLRLLFEVQAKEPGALANQSAAIAFNERLSARYRARFAKFDRIRDLFLCDASPGQFSLWHGLTFAAGSPELKLYLNPQTFGAANALPLVCEALQRLGLSRAIPTLQRVARLRGDLDEPNYFALDLSDEDSARVKVYFRHEAATVADLEKVFSQAPTHQAGDVTAFVRAMVGATRGFHGKPVSSCFSFTQASEGPSAVTFHLPIAHYAPDDAISVARSAAFLTAAGQPRAAEMLVNSVRSIAPRPLKSGVGVQSYASFRREGSELRFTAYLSPELFRDADGDRSRTHLRPIAPDADSAERWAGAK